MQVWCFSFLIVCVSVISFTVSLPTTTVGTDQITTSSDSGVPREFPNLSQNYTFVDNSSIRENLASHSETDTEIEDLLSENKKETKENPPENEDADPVPNPSEQDEGIGRKDAIEWIEDGEDTEDKKFVTETNPPSTTEEDENAKTSEVKTEKQTTPKIESTPEGTESEISEKPTTVTPISTKENNEPYKDGVPVIDGSVAAILVVTFLVVCIFGYAALILWRRSLEIKYGSREMLVDRDDMYDPDDLKHFSI